MTTLTLRRGRQTVGFFRKESIDIGRQPRLILMLVLGPFLILVAFGLGYKSSPDPYRTLFVIPPGSPFAGRVETYAADLGHYVQYVGSTTDVNAAEARLRKGDVDVVVAFPADPLGTVLSGKQAPITIMHTQLDPVEQTAIDFASRLAVDEINSQILASIVSQGQQAARPLGDVFSTATDAVHAADQALSGSDATTAQAASDRPHERSRPTSLDARAHGRPEPAARHQRPVDAGRTGTERHRHADANSTRKPAMCRRRSPAATSPTPANSWPKWTRT